VFGQVLADLAPSTLRRLQCRIGTVSQRLDLIEQVRVLHNVNAGRLGTWSTPRAMASLIRARADDDVRSALRSVGMDWALHERTERLSGGERQRVAIARLLMQQPARGSTLVISLHQPELARQYCTRAIGLREGRLVFDVPTAELDDARLTRLYTIP
jgi:phosphonate transport system ATP-binding protein